MKLYVQLGLILLAFSAVATALLAYVNSLTSPIIVANKIEAANVARDKLIPNADFEKGSGNMEYYIARDKDSKAILGYTFTAEKVGYSGKVRTMAAVDTAFQIINIDVIEQTETPGLGSNATKPEFTKQFQGKKSEQLVVDKDGGIPPNGIVSLTGATITTRAVTNSLREYVMMLKDEITKAVPAGEAK